MKYPVTFLFIFVMFFIARHSSAAAPEAQQFIDEYTKNYLPLYKNSSLAQWKLHVEIKPGDESNIIAAYGADKAMAAFTGSEENITRARYFLLHKNKLTNLQIKQLELILYLAANNPQTVAPLVKQRIQAENKQTHQLYGYQYVLGNQKVGLSEIDLILQKGRDLNKRLKAWEASKQVGTVLKEGLINLRNLRNKSVQALGYPDFFSYQVTNYNLSTNEMMDMMDNFMKELYPLYRELHTWMRYELAKKYGVSQVPNYLPAHWLPDRWGQDWSAAVDIKHIDLDETLSQKTPEWIVTSGENLYVSLGYPKLPKTFWQRSSLYPYSPNAFFKKSHHASAWHMDLDQDIRSIMNLESNAKSFRTAHHELGHIYYYLAYSNNKVPPLLRRGANRAYHEAIGTMMGLAAMQKSYLIDRGLINDAIQTDIPEALLKEALNSVVFIYFSAGTMTHFEKKIYQENLSGDLFNITWWKLAKKYQGIVPPTTRGEEYCDAATKIHINKDPAQYYDYALSYVLLYQLHNHIAKYILHTDPHNTNYYGQKGIGSFLMNIMHSGATTDWRILLKQSTGEDLTAKAMKEYFHPLMGWLQQQNKGRVYTLPENFD